MGIVTQGSQSAIGSALENATDAAYFDAIYSNSDDPWDMHGRWYEQRKRALLAAVLPRQRYARAFEPGCGNGLFTEVLAGRCDAVVASDLSDRAVHAARTRLQAHPHVEINQGTLPADLPAGRFDLIVVGELGYYFEAAAWMRVAHRLRACLTADGTLMACHWKAPFDARRLDTTFVHDALRMTGGMHTQCLHDEPDFVVEVWTCSNQSLGAREGLR